MSKTSGGGGRSGGNSIESITEKIENMGGRRWSKGGNDRVYVPESVVASNIPETISGVGRMSKNDIRNIINNNSGVYFDRNTGKMSTPRMQSGYKQYMQEALNISVSAISKNLGL
jgi:hypothetical protein